MNNRDRRNLNPHKAARVAMWIYGAVYAKQNGGSMDFWDGLPEAAKALCRQGVQEIEAAPSEPKKGAVR